jgi:chromosome segregation ATPase
LAQETRRPLDVQRLEERLEARFAQLDSDLRHHQALEAERFEQLRASLEDIRRALADQETRLRAATDGVAQFKVWASLTSGSSGLLSILALLKSLGG